MINNGMNDLSLIRIIKLSNREKYKHADMFIVQHKQDRKKESLFLYIVQIINV